MVARPSAALSMPQQQPRSSTQRRQHSSAQSSSRPLSAGKDGSVAAILYCDGCDCHGHVLANCPHFAGRSRGSVPWLAEVHPDAVQPSGSEIAVNIASGNLPVKNSCFVRWPYTAGPCQVAGCHRATGLSGSQFPCFRTWLTPLCTWGVLFVSCHPASQSRCDRLGRTRYRSLSFCLNTRAFAHPLRSCDGLLRVQVYQMLTRVT